MTQEKANEVCRIALPFSVYKKIGKDEMISVANSIMFYCACMVKKMEDFDCDIEFKLNFKNKLF